MSVIVEGEEQEMCHRQLKAHAKALWQKGFWCPLKNNEQKPGWFLEVGAKETNEIAQAKEEVWLYLNLKKLL